MQGIRRHRVSIDGVKKMVNNAHLDGRAIQKSVYEWKCKLQRSHRYSS
jgi:hypothetical protein